MGPIILKDDSVKGFILRISPLGKKTWGADLNFRKNLKKIHKQVTLGCHIPESRRDHTTLAAARRRFFEVKDYYIDGGDRPDFMKDDPKDLIPEVPKYTVWEMVDEAITLKKSTGKAVSPKTWVNYERYARYIKGSFPEDFPAEKVTVSICQELHTDYGSRVQGNRMMDFFRSCFNSAIQLEKLVSNPAGKIQKNKEVVRDPSATMDDFSNILEWGKKHEPPIFYWFFLTLAMSGTRVEQHKRMMWTDLSEGIWFKNGKDAKNQKDSMVYLGEDIVEEFRTLGNNDHPYVFGNYSYRKPWERAREANGCPKFTVHDIRHVTGSHLLNDGHELKHISGFLQHSGTKVTERYAKLKSDFKHQATAVRNSAQRSGSQKSDNGLEP